jgi:phosphoribosylaminoimidazolecarboxamide formyltransferase/IMP cyclohydrolase
MHQLGERGIAPFDLLVANLYPFQDTVASGAEAAACIEQIDIGGPAMIRAAAKNHDSVAVVVSPRRYPDVLSALRSGGFDASARRELAAEAFAHTAAYDVAVATWFAAPTEAVVPTERGSDELVAASWPAFLGKTFTMSMALRYGENPHQAAALYLDDARAVGLAQAEVLHGKPMSYNNYVDTEAARRAAHDFAEPCVAIVKHANPCGIAIGTDVADAHRKAHASDPVSAFGGVVATNRTVTEGLARQVAEVFTEVVCAPGFEPAALDVLRSKKNIRLLRCSPPSPHAADVEWRQISGGLLVQHPDRLDAPGDDAARWTLVSGGPADQATLRDLAFAWRAVRAVRSNAILLAAAGATVGIGMGQVNRVDAVRLAVARAGDRAKGAVAASDAYFPFPDGLQALIDAGVRAVVQPGGSVRDSEVIEAARAAGLTMYLTGTRHFAH